MMIGTSGRSALALGKSSRPLIPGMLMSDRIKMSEASPASLMRSALGRLGKLHGEPAFAEVAPNGWRNKTSTSTNHRPRISRFMRVLPT